MNPGAWTKAAPTAPGWYWLKLPGEQPVVCKVWMVDSTLPLTCFAGHVGEFESQGWCGPLPVPEDFCACGDELKVGEAACVNCRFAREGKE